MLAQHVAEGIQQQEHEEEEDHIQDGESSQPSAWVDDQPQDLLRHFTRVLQDPAETAQEILGLIIDPSRRLAAFTLLYTSFFLFIFLLLYSFSHMLREQIVMNQDAPEQIASTQPSNVQS